MWHINSFTVEIHIELMNLCVQKKDIHIEYRYNLFCKKKKINRFIWSREGGRIYRAKTQWLRSVWKKSKKKKRIRHLRANSDSRWCRVGEIMKPVVSIYTVFQVFRFVNRARTTRERSTSGGGAGTRAYIRATLLARICEQLWFPFGRTKETHAHMCDVLSWKQRRGTVI